MTEVLKKSDLTLKTCFDAFKASPFTVETFLYAREACLNAFLLEHENDYIGIVSHAIRELFAESLRQAFTIFTDKESERIIFEFTNRIMLPIIGNLWRILKESTADRSQLTQMWHSTVLAGEALKAFSADFSLVLEDIFVTKMAEFIKKDFEDRIKLIEVVDCKNEIQIEMKYDLNTTIALNSIVDAINQVRLCPSNQELKRVMIDYIENVPVFTENIKTFARSKF